jgi:branched-chain amino acid transport system permease protein
MDELLQTLIVGVSNGLIISLVALGFTMVYAIIELINFAHGDVFMIGSFIALALISGLGVGRMDLPMQMVTLLGILLVTAFATAIINAAIEIVAYRRLRNAPKIQPLIAAIGMSFVLENIAIIWRGPDTIGIDPLFSNANLLAPLGITTISITVKQVLVVGVTIPAMILLGAFINRTKLGMAMRATAQDLEMAGVMGIDVNRTISLAFIIGGALAGVAGVVQIAFNNATVWILGFRFGLNAFTAAVMGGIGNVKGAVLGGIILGILNAFSDRYISTAWTNALVFGVLIATLVLRPNGLFGRQVSDRA